MRCDDLIRDNVITSSVASLLFNEKKRAMVIRSTSFPSIAFNAGLLYTVLLQAFVLAKSIKSGTSLKEERYSDMLVDNIKRTWMYTGVQNDLLKEGKPWVFSYLIQCASSKQPKLFGDNAVHTITVAKSALLKTEDNSRRFSDLLTEKELLDYLNSLPLLRTTYIDWENMQFVFEADGEDSYSIDCSPFICFWNNKKNIQSKERTSDCYVITSLRKGKQLGELCVNLLPLSSRDSEIATKQIYWNAAKNETVRMIFKSLDISTDWLSTEKCWCDLAFMQKLANVTEEILPKYWGMKNSDIRVLCVRDRVANLFYDSSIKNDVLKKNHPSKKLLVTNIDNVLFGLFINHGIFKTMREMFDESSITESEKPRKVLFDLFIETFVTKKYITPEVKDVYLEECNREIESHIAALRTKVPYDNSPQFKRRSHEITAEWRAFTVLKAAGIRADNLFADKESIYSIDDFYNMLQNPRTSLQDDLKQVLGLLIEIYGALMDNKPVIDASNGSTGMYINEDAFYSSMHSIRDTLSSLNLEKHFDRFLDIVNRAEGNEIVEGVLGRTCICRSENVINFKADILDSMANEHKVKELAPVGDPDPDKYIFISYSHEDTKLIEPFLSHWKEKGWKIYIDKERFYKGAPWDSAALSAIKDKNCAMVAAFISENSLVSDPVATELTCAQNTAESRFGKNSNMCNRFIHPINLYPEEEIFKISRNIKINDENKSHRAIATEISKIITGIDLYSTIDDMKPDAIEKFDCEILEMLTFHEDPVSTMRDSVYTDLELQVAKFYTFLKYNVTERERHRNIHENIHRYFLPPSRSHLRISRRYRIWLPGVQDLYKRCLASC